MSTDRILVIDDAVPQPDVYRAGALALPFGDLSDGAQTFHGMARIGSSPLSQALEVQGLTTTFEAFRLSPLGQEEPNFIHADRGMGNWSGVLYLNPDPPLGDGTVFYRRLADGAIESAATDDPAEWRDASRWEPWHAVTARFNRLVLFPSSFFHARALFANWGAGRDARLVQLIFGTGDLPVPAGVR